jgi:hypothetical protein
MKYLMIAVAALFVAECAIAQTTSTSPAPKNETEAKASAAKDAALRDANAHSQSSSTLTFGGHKKNKEGSTKDTSKGEAPGSMMTAAEKDAHQKKLSTFKTADECKTYMTAHSAEMEARAKAQNKTLRPAQSDPCKKLETPAKAAAK